MVSIDIFRKKYNLVEFIVLILIGSSLLGYLKFYSYNRFDIMLDTWLIELKCPVHIASISDSNCWLSEFFCSLCESLRITECLLEGVVSMCMEMDKWHMTLISWQKRNIDSMFDRQRVYKKILELQKKSENWPFIVAYFSSWWERSREWYSVDSDHSTRPETVQLYQIGWHPW